MDMYQVPSSSQSAPSLETPKYQNGLCSSPSQTYLLEIPKDVSGLSVEEVLECLRCLNLAKHVERFLEEQIDGELLVSVDREMLTAELGFQSFEAMKLEKFARHGWRPKRVSMHHILLIIIISSSISINILLVTCRPDVVTFLAHV